MLTKQERAELERLRADLADDRILDSQENTKDYWWYPTKVAQLVELERRDAMEQARAECER